MQAKHLEAVSATIDEPRIKPKKVKSQMKQLAATIKKDLPELPDPLRTPTSAELTQMRSYGMEYKKNNKKASNREIRRAIQKRFNIKIYK
jgi:ribosomal protein L16 Arg81 hydroxylase